MRRRAQVTAVKLLLATLLLSASMPLAAQTHAAAGERTAVPEHYSGATVDRASASAQPQAVRDSVDENFVIASLLVSEPGGALYSRLGHAALRMQCPEHGLDYVFTYTSEDIFEKPLAFLAGKLKMGLVAISPEEYLEDYRAAGRGVSEYALNLPIEAKRNLWRVLDNHLAEGMDLEFDYIRRGCAQSTLMFLKEGLNGVRSEDCPEGLKFEFGQWPEYFEGNSRREITYEHLKEYKWMTFLMHFICNGIIDHVGSSNEQKTIIPADLPLILSNATADGLQVIDSGPREVLPNVWQPKRTWPTPMLVSLLLLALTIACALFGSTFMDYVLLGLQTLLGLVAVFLLCSSLVCTEWSWLIVPFNPLPLIFWKWRCRWALPYAVVLLVWCAFMLFWPHLLTDVAYVVLTMGLVVSYVSIYLKSKSLQK